MDALWRFLVYDAMPLIAVVVAVGAAVRVVMVLGLRSDAVSAFLDHLAKGASLRSTLGGLRSIRPMAPESGLVELASADGANREEVLRLLGTAEGQFWRRIRPLEVWTSASGYLTGILVLITLIYVSSALHSLTVGLSLEIEHNTTAILDVIHNILAVVFRNTWVVLCLFVLNALIKLRVRRRRERWATLANRLTQEVAKG